MAFGSLSGASILGSLGIDFTQVSSSSNNCWDQIAPCEPGTANNMHGLVLGLQNAIQQAQAAQAAGDPAAASAILNYKAQLQTVLNECAARARGCQTLVASVAAKLAQYGCDATKGPMAEALQAAANEKLATADQVPENGTWDVASCAAWWKAFNRAPTREDVVAEIGPTVMTLFTQQKHCGLPADFAVAMPNCPKPAPKAIPKPPPIYYNKPLPVGPKPGPVTVTPYVEPPKKMNMAVVGGVLAAVAVVGYYVAKKKGMIG